MSSLNAANVHYVRCLKPNSENTPNKFDRPYMMSQLKANGIIETVKISQQGHPARLLSFFLSIIISLFLFYLFFYYEVIN